MKQLMWGVSALALILIFLNCGKEKPLPTGYSDIFGDKEGQILDTLLVQESGTEAFYSRLINTGAAASLLLGNYQNYHSAIYMKFGKLPDGARVHTAKLYLTKNPVDSTLSGPDQTFTIYFYHAKYDWKNDQDPEQYLDQLPFNDLPFQTATITPAMIDTIVIELDALVVTDWADTSSGLINYGFWMDSNLEGINGYYSINNADLALQPRLELIYTVTDTTGNVRDTTTVYATTDAFLTPDTGAVLTNLDRNYFFIGKELAFRSFLKFDLSRLDTTLHLNRALMEIVINKDNSIGKVSNASDIIIFRKDEDLKDKKIVNENPSTSSYAGTLVADTLSFDVTRTVQGWIGKNFPNYGFLVRSLNEEQTISRIAFHSTISSIELQPRLYLYYTLPPKQEF